ncbi:LOW QUALITY PROTEIN: striatin-4 [Tyto alba]|uniref:LOW QUALITY PROTEIN: striatin-4 n=1 Tax=Tyto alba TaxID=56313 RepID=UPI001C680EF2|nr:LOW QUALITY PROTEIN: striatin-4 [Tyto alba]
MAAERAAAARAQPPPPGAPPGSCPGPGPGPGPGPEPAARGGLSLPGILHFIQHEWARFEAEKGRWEAERAELQAQVAFLQGERKGQENLKTDLVRRIKMLEYALKQERSKYHKLKFGTELTPGEKKPEGTEPVSNGPAEVASLEGGPLAWKEGRQLLRQYLEEVGYSDTILDMRSRRVRSLLGRGPPAPPAPGSPPATDSLLVRRIEEQIQRNAGKETEERGGGGGLEQVPPFPPGGEDEDSDEDEDAESLPPPAQPQHKKQRVKLTPKPLLPEVEDEDDDEDSEDALNEFDFLGSGENGAGRRAGEGVELESRRGRLRGMLADLRDVDGLPPKPAAAGPPRPPEGSLGITSDVFIMDSIGGGAVSLGDLADLTVTNDNELSCDLPEGRDALKKTWSPKFTLRSHYDAVRGLAFHPAEAALLTASEDGTLKLWNLQKPVAPKKNAALDVEPVYAFRGHRGPVLAVAMGRDSALCCSAGVDARIRRWRLPDLDMDPYDGYDPGVLSGVLEGHGDAVWGLSFNPAGDRLASCSADGTVRIWDPRREDSACLSTYDAQSEHGVPTSVTFSATQPGHAVAAFRTGAVVLYDVEAARPVLVLEARPGGGGSQVNQVVSHPSQPVTITASDDRGIRFLDNRTGQVVHSMVAHLDAVTCLAVDPNGVFLMSGSHDCSLRLWHLAHKTCVQELTAHRKKHEEAVHAVAFHPSRALSASAGADALAKVFV